MEQRTRALTRELEVSCLVPASRILSKIGCEPYAGKIGQSISGLFM